MTLTRRFGLLALVTLLASVYTMSNAGRFHIVDEVSLFSVTESLALRASIDTNAIAWTQWVNSPGEVLGAFGPNGEVYSKKGPAPAFLAVPWYLFLHTLGRWGVGLGLLQGTLLWNGFITALTAGMLWLVAVRLGYDDRVAGLLGLLFGLCTIAWPYATQFFGEPLSALSLLICFYAFLCWHDEYRTSWMIAAGVSGAVAITTVTSHAALVSILAVGGFLPALIRRRSLSGNAPDAAKASRPSWSKLLWAGGLFLTPIVIGGLLLLWYNQARFGNPLTTGYHFDSGEGFTTPIWIGLWGLLISPYRGVFWFTPLFLASLWGGVLFVRRHRTAGLIIAALSIALIAIYSTWWMWWGGFAWGPRFLVPLTPFWVLLLAPLVQQMVIGNRQVARTLRGRDWLNSLRAPGLGGWALILLAAASFLVQVFGVSINFVNYEIQLRSLYPTDWSDPLKFGPPHKKLPIS